MIFPTFRSTETFSYEQYVRVLDEMGKLTDLFHCELLDGRIYMTPPAGGPHAAVQENLYAAISSFVRAHRLGKVFGPSAGYRLNTDIVVEPDLGFLSEARMAALPTLEEGKFLGVPPDLAIEIVSQSDRGRDLIEKRLIYERHRVAEYWIVDPREKVVHLLLLEGGHYRETVLKMGDAVESRVLDGMRIPVSDVFEGLP